MSEPAAEQQAQIKEAALAALMRRDHSKKELFDKLSRKFHGSALIPEVLDRLEEVDLINDLRFAEAFTRSKSNAGKGPYAIRQLLQAKGVDRDTIQASIQSAEADWQENAAEVYQRKYKDKPILDYADKAKRQRFLLSRGFAMDIVQTVLSK